MEKENTDIFNTSLKNPIFQLNQFSNEELKNIKENLSKEDYSSIMEKGTTIFAGVSYIYSGDKEFVKAKGHLNLKYTKNEKENLETRKKCPIILMIIGWRDIKFNSAGGNMIEIESKERKTEYPYETVNRTAKKELSIDIEETYSKITKDHLVFTSLAKIGKISHVACQFAKKFDDLQEFRKFASLCQPNLIATYAIVQLPIFHENDSYDPKKSFGLINFINQDSFESMYGNVVLKHFCFILLQSKLIDIQFITQTLIPNIRDEEKRKDIQSVVDLFEKAMTEKIEEISKNEDKSELVSILEDNFDDWTKELILKKIDKKFLDSNQLKELLKKNDSISKEIPKSSQNNNKNFNSKKLCVFYAKGKCKNGSNCTFSHN